MSLIKIKVRNTSLPTVHAALFAAGLLLVLLLAPAKALATAGVGKPTFVSIGDSYIAGEAGRWKGNSNRNKYEYHGTDRVRVDTQLKDVYPAKGYFYKRNDPFTFAHTPFNYSYKGCHRSDVAPVTGLKRLFENRANADDNRVIQTVNLACSGAVSRHLLPNPSVVENVPPGEVYRGEPPQLNQLAEVATRTNVRVIVISIGGNDLGFSDIITQCATTFKGRCQDQPVVQAKTSAAAFDGVATNVTNVVNSTKAVMQTAGYTYRQDYRIILQSYPSPIPLPANDTTNPQLGEFRYASGGLDRSVKGGCPFADVDALWAVGTLLPRVSSRWRAIAAATDVDFLDVSQAFKGHEVCGFGSHRAPEAQGLGGRRGVDGLPHPSSSMEWIRFIVSPIYGQGTLEESLHPNYFGQKAESHCIDRMIGLFGVVANAGQSVQRQCLNSGLNARTRDMRLELLPALPVPVPVPPVEVPQLPNNE